MNHVHEVLRPLEALQLALHDCRTHHVLLRHALHDNHSLHTSFHAARMSSRMRVVGVQRLAAAESCSQSTVLESTLVG